MDTEKRKRGRPLVADRPLSQQERHERWLQRLTKAGLLRKSVIIPGAYISLVDEFMAALCNEKTREIAESAMRMTVNVARQFEQEKSKTTQEAG